MCQLAVYAMDKANELHERLNTLEDRLSKLETLDNCHDKSARQALAAISKRLDVDEKALQMHAQLIYETAQHLADHTHERRQQSKPPEYLSVYCNACHKTITAGRDGYHYRCQCGMPLATIIPA